MEMTIEKFIENFRSQLADEHVEVLPNTNYTKEDYWDSLTSMVVKTMIEDEYGIDIDPKEINSYSSIQDLYNRIQG